MGTLAITAVSGEGSQSLSGGAFVNVSDIVVELVSVTSPRVRQYGSLEPLRFIYAGSYGTADSSTSPIDSSGPHLYSSSEFNIHFDFMDVPMPIQPFFSSDVWWKLPPGVTANFFVTWT